MNTVWTWIGFCLIVGVSIVVYSSRSGGNEARVERELATAAAYDSAAPAEREAQDSTESDADEAIDETQFNRMCPVLTDELALAEIAIQYKGKTVRFCCNECVAEFQKHPEIYEGSLPQLLNRTWVDRIATALKGGVSWVVITLLGSVLIGLRVYNSRRAGSQEASRLLGRKIPLAVPACVACVLLGGYVFKLRQEAYDRMMEDHIHFATFYDFGFPATPRRPDIVASLKGTYYRGNDERSARLFNDGNYRTSKFMISLVDADGNTLKVGDRIVGKDVHVRLEIERPPFTPDFLYKPDVMSTMFMTSRCEKFLGRSGPVDDRAEVENLEPMQRWHVRYSIGDLANCGGGCCSSGKASAKTKAAETRRGIVYVAERLYHTPYPWSSPTRIGSRYHYAIEYRLNIEDGRLASGSDLFMGALYRTRKLPTWKVPIDQWFSHNPIPELPGKNVDDPELLGITDHAEKVSAVQE